MPRDFPGISCVQKLAWPSGQLCSGQLYPAKQLSPALPCPGLDEAQGWAVPGHRRPTVHSYQLGREPSSAQGLGGGQRLVYLEMESCARHTGHPAAWQMPGVRASRQQFFFWDRARRGSLSVPVLEPGEQRRRKRTQSY